jgi:hypothetical protein
VPFGTKEPTLLFLLKGMLSFTNAEMKKIQSDPKFSQMPETDERVEVKKLVEANCFMPLVTFPKWSTSHLLR